MKRLLSLLLVLSLFSAEAQTKGTAKLYAYRQGVAAGMAPKDLQEDGTQTTASPKRGENLYLYLATTSRAYPSEIWINGQPYGVSLQSIKSTPVQHIDASVPSEPVTTTLVPKTTRRVIQLTPTETVTSKLSNKGRSLAKTNELVVVYKQSGKFYYQTMSKINSLKTAAGQ